VAGNHPMEALDDSTTGRVYLVDGRMDVLDARSGRTLGTILSPKIDGLPGATFIAAVDGRVGRVLAGGVGALSGDAASRGGLSILAASTDRLVRTLALRMLPEAIAVSPDGRQALVLEMSLAYADGTSIVEVIDVPHARLVRTIPLGAYAAALAIDDATGRAFVAGPRFVRMLDAFHGTALGPIASLP
jgi:DNA-binding beta-propeller fold protein YncE